MYNLDSMDKRLVIFGYMFRVANRLQSKMDTQMKDMTAKQWFVILALGLFDQPPTLKQLAITCDTSHQNTKQLVMKLEKKGFVSISNDDKDGRAMRITVTEQFRQWDKENEQNATLFINQMFSGIDHDEVKNLCSSIIKIFENLDNIEGENTNV